MKKVIVIELVDNKQLNISGPLEHDRSLCIQMLEEALKVARSYKGGMLLVQNQSLFTGLAENVPNHQLRQPL